MEQHLPPSQIFIDLLHANLDDDARETSATLFSEIGAWGMNLIILEMLFDYWAEREGRTLLTARQLEMARDLVRNQFVGTLEELVAIAPLLVGDLEFMD